MKQYIFPGSDRSTDVVKKCSYMQVAAIDALLVAFLSRILFKHQRKLNLSPGPIALPIIGCFHLLGKQPYKSFADLAQKYGPIMAVQLGQRYYIVATFPEVVKEFLKHQDSNFSSWPCQRSAQIIFTEAMLQPKLPHLRAIKFVCQ